MLSFLYVYSDHSILECYNLFSGVELSMRSFFVIWDEVLPYDLKKKWQKWLQSLPKEISVPTSITSLAHAITPLEVHGFGDASVIGCSALVYLVIHQDEWINQGLLTVKSRLSKRDLMMPRLELVATHDQ